MCCSFLLPFYSYGPNLPPFSTGSLLGPFSISECFSIWNFCHYQFYLYTSIFPSFVIIHFARKEFSSNESLQNYAWFHFLSSSIPNKKIDRKEKNWIEFLWNFLFQTEGICDLPSIFLCQIIAGCYLTVGGALLGLINPGRMSLFGILLIIWGLVREGILRKSASMNPIKTFQFYPAMSIAVVFAALSIRKDVRKLIRSSRARQVGKCMRSKAKYMWLEDVRTCTCSCSIFRRYFK